MRTSILLLSLVTAATAFAQGNVVAYRAVGTEATIIKPSGTQLPALPDTLVIAPGEYIFGGNTYKLTEPGLYRFLDMGQRQEQRIVDTGDVHTLMSALAWLHVHGTTDDKLAPDVLESEAKTRKLVASCGAIAGLATRILRRHGVSARVVATLAGPPYNTYDNGHTLFEVYRRDLGKWMVYDLDNNAYYEADGKPLSTMELIRRIPTNDYKVMTLAADGIAAARPPSDPGFDYSFYFELISGTEAALRNWLARVARVALIHDGGVFYFSSGDADLRKAVEKYSKAYRYLDDAEFMKRYYAAPPIMEAQASR
jgi:hypothetical protein